MTNTQDALRIELEKLIKDVSNKSFRCGEFNEEYECDEAYEPLLLEANEAEKKLIDFVLSALFAAPTDQSQHDSDCAMYNEPAYPAGQCDCSKSVQAAQKERVGKLPPLPKSFATKWHPFKYTEEQMHEYARAALQEQQVAQPVAFLDDSDLASLREFMASDASCVGLEVTLWRSRSRGWNPIYTSPPSFAPAGGEKIAEAYGYLWHVNNGIDAPPELNVPSLTPEAAAYKARRILRDLLTNEQRGKGINDVRTALANQDQEKAK